MAYWWQRSSSTPDNNIAPPPDGAPEGHFPDQLNNIQRQALAAVAEIGDLVLGPGDGSAPPQSAPSGINSDFLKVIYDSLLAVGTMQAWNSLGGTVPFPVPSGSAFSSVAWQICDGTNGTPDLRRGVLGGADPDNASPLFTGDVTGDANTGDAGGHTPSGMADGTILTIAQIPPHSHVFIGDAVPDHIHGYKNYPAGGNAGPGGTAGGQQTNRTTDPAGGHTPSGTNAPEGGGLEHGHSLSMDAVPDHNHPNDPLRVSIEIYQRIA